MQKENCMILSFFSTAEAKVPTFESPIENVSIGEGESALLQTKLSAFPTPAVKWLKDGVVLQPSPHYDFVSLPDGIIGLK